MEKHEMLKQLGAAAPEWDGYVQRTSEFMRSLSPEDQKVHQRLSCSGLLSLLAGASAEDLTELFASDADLMIVLGGKNCCNQKPKPNPGGGGDDGSSNSAQ